jgi:DNA-binding transcriptional LysR family regulator
LDAEGSQTHRRHVHGDVDLAIHRPGTQTRIVLAVDKQSLWNVNVDGDPARSLGSAVPDLRQMRYVVKVAELGGFTAAAAELHVAQQAVSQQIKATEQLLGVRLFRRAPRAVIVTPAGEVFLREAKRVLNAAERLADRTRAAARGEVGPLRVAYTMTSAYETFPELQAALKAALPGLTVRAREVFGSDVPALLINGDFDLALAPRFPLPDGLESQPLRVEPLLAAVSQTHPLADRASIELRELHNELFELWPRDMSPGYYDAVVAACRSAGFEPRIDASAAGSIVWGNIARGRGVGLIVKSLQSQLPQGVCILPLHTPRPAPLHIDVAWSSDPVLPAVERFNELARHVADCHHWLQPDTAQRASPIDSQGD